MNSLVLNTEPIAQKVVCNDDELNVYLSDGRLISVPIIWFPRLMNASQEQRNNYQLLGLGEGIYWEESKDIMKI